MNREKVKEFLPILEAFAAGEIIQTRMPDGEWFATADITGKGEYRIKPTPREFWIDTADFEVLEQIERPCRKNDTSWIFVREVTDE